MTTQAIHQILIVKFSQTKLRWKTLEIVALQYKGKKTNFGTRQIWVSNVNYTTSQLCKY